MNKNAMFQEQSPVDAINSAANMLCVLRDRFDEANGDYPAWQLLGLVIESLRATAKRTALAERD